MNFVYVTTSVTVNSAPRLFRVRAVAGTVYDGIVAKAFLPSITKDNCTASDFIDENLKKFHNAWVHFYPFLNTVIINLQLYTDKAETTKI